MAQLQPGDRAPSFTLVDQHGGKVRLADFRGRPLVVFFYPKADTPGCTTQACALRDERDELARLGAAVVGISPDPPAKQERFDAKHGLGYPLLADEDHRVAERWGAWGERSLYGRRFMGIIRSAFVVGPDGRIAAAFYKVSPKDTAPKVRAALAGLAGG
jgi:peroxiredoxin Q/BCP